MTTTPTDAPTPTQPTVSQYDVSAIVEFLNVIVTGDTGWFCVSVSQADNMDAYSEQWFKWPDDRDRIAVFALTYAYAYNVYFSSYLFSAQRRTKGNTLPSRTFQADLDESDISMLPIPPAALVQTSPGRHQAFWVLNETLDLASHETLSRKLTYAIDKADHSGWPIGHTARMPLTYNHKYLDGPKQVLIKILDPQLLYGTTIFELLPDAEKPDADLDETWLDDINKLSLPTTGPNELLDRFKQQQKLPIKIIAQYNVPQKDRSEALWALMLALFRASATRTEVYYLAKNSANNKFDRLRYNANRELGKDVLRAEATARRRSPDVRRAVIELRRTSGPPFMKKRQLSDLVIQTLSAEGEFIHTSDNQLWYVKRDSGRPILLDMTSEYMSMLMDVQFGLNATETEKTYSCASMMSHTLALPPDTRIGALSHYDIETNTMMLHTGGRDTLKITKDSIDRVSNGAGGVLFPWNPANEIFRPDYAPLPDGETWYSLLYGNSFANTQDISTEEAEAVMRVWAMFLLFRSASATRPILALVGPPGSGKTTLMKRLYRLLYGSKRELTEASTKENFEISTTKDPFVVLDNVDTWERWFADSFALSISDVDIPKRKLWHDSDIVYLKRQAVLGLTAHNPKWGREDVADRLILLTFARWPHADDSSKDDGFLQEQAMLYSIIQNRNKIWGHLILDLQKVLATPTPERSGLPKFRIQDFAVIGVRIARALGREDSFVRALSNIGTEQRLFTLEEDNQLVAAIYTYVTRQKELKWVNAGSLWSELQVLADNPNAFTHAYRNSVSLNKKIGAMQEALSQIFVIEHRYDASKGSNQWRFQLKPNLTHAPTTHENGIVTDVDALTVPIQTSNEKTSN